MLIPYGTDAPIYHLPYATGALIAANVALFMGDTWMWANLSEAQYERIITELFLVYGHGLRPWQWLTSIFMHADIFHLLGNMFCLWGFGLVVEGKVGWWRFLAIYLGIGVGQSAAEQTMMFFVSEGGSLGASAAIFGILAVALVWAPQNEMNCLFLLGFRPIVFDTTLYSLAVVAVLIELGTGYLAGMRMGSQVLHLMGATAGFAVGVYMLKKNWVDCEGWDLFNVLRGTERSGQNVREEEEAAAKALLDESHTKRMRRLSEGESETPQPTPVPTPVPYPAPLANLTPANMQSPPLAAPAPAGLQSPPLGAGPVGKPPTTPLNMVPDDDAVRAMRRTIQAGDPQRAFLQFQQYAGDPLNWPLPERELLQTISLFHQRKLWRESIPALEEYLKHFTERDAAVRLKLAQILIEVARRPDRAREVLAPLNEPLLGEKEAALLGKLRAKC